MLGKEETRTGCSDLSFCQVSWAVQSINAATRTAIGGFDDKGIIFLWNPRKKAGMGNKVGTWNGQPLSMCKGSGNGLVAHQADRSGVIDGGNPSRLCGFQDTQPRAIGYRF